MILLLLLYFLGHPTVSLPHWEVEHCPSLRKTAPKSYLSPQTKVIVVPD